MNGGDGLEAALARRLDGLAQRGETLELWWRDDDAVQATGPLERLVGLSAMHAVPLCLAVIPRHAERSLAEMVGDGSLVWISQHGWAHENHEPAGRKAAELGAARPAEVVLDELRRGRERLSALFPRAFRPVLTPPWNRLAEQVAARRAEAGLPGLSAFAAEHAADPLCRNTHLDPIAWKRWRGFVGTARMLQLLDEELARPHRGPIGLLTHHLDHDEAVWDFSETFVRTTASHPAARWLGPDELFPSLRAAA